MGFQEIVKFAKDNSPLIAIFSSAFAALAAIAAWRNSAIAKKTQINQRLNQLLEYRYNIEMFNAKKELRTWYENNGRENIGQKFIANRFTDEGQKLDNHRNTFIVYFQKIYDLYRERLLRKKEIKPLINATDMAILISIGKPIQESVDSTVLKLEISKDIEIKTQSIFDFYEELYQKGYIAGSGIRKKTRYYIFDFFSRR
jgi:hypothetical protein